MSRLFDPDGMVAPVTGAARGIGRAMALRRSGFARMTTAAACLLLPGAPAAQTAQAELDAYARVVAIVNGTTAYVGGSLLACTAANALSEAEAEARFKSYRERNAALVARAEAWSREMETRMRAQGVERAARARAEEESMSAIAGSSQQAEREIGVAPAARAACVDRLAAIEAGAFDLSRNPELLGLLGR